MLIAGGPANGQINGDTVQLSGITTSNSTTVTGLSSTSGLAIGDDVFGLGIPSGTTTGAGTGINRLDYSAYRSAVYVTW